MFIYTCTFIYACKHFIYFVSIGPYIYRNKNNDEYNINNN